MCKYSILIKFQLRFPNWLTIILLFILLIFTAIRSFQKGIKVFLEEARVKSKEGTKSIDMDYISEENTIIFNSDEDEENVIQKPENIPTKNTEEIEVQYFERNSLDEDPNDGKVKLLEFDQVEIIENPQISQDLKLMLKEEESRYPYTTLLILLFSWSILVFFSFLKGGKGKSLIGIQACSASYWGLAMIIFPILFSISLGYGIYLRLKHEKKIKLKYPFQVFNKTPMKIFF